MTKHGYITTEQDWKEWCGLFLILVLYVASAVFSYLFMSLGAAFVVSFLLYFGFGFVIQWGMYRGDESQKREIGARVLMVFLWFPGFIAVLFPDLLD